MRTLTPLLSNWLWNLSSGPHYERFLQTIDRVEEVQSTYLLRLLRHNSKTKYGKRYGFSQITSVEAFRQAVPLTKYEDYAMYIDEIAEGKNDVLTADRVTLFQPSSGTSSASKLIPYTKSLKADFQRAIATWIFSVFKRKPATMKGLAYWSVSPPAQRKRFHGVVPVGFDEDAEYLGFFGKWLFDHVTAVPSNVTSITESEVFFNCTLVYLLAAENLALISVWSPTLLTMLLRKFIEHHEEIIKQLADSRLPGAKPRAQTIRHILKQRQLASPFSPIWPYLDLISCWTHGPSEIYAQEVRKYFPDVEIQGKGLVATEAFVSLPLLVDKDPVLAVDSHFFEFREVESGNIQLAHELREGRIYSVVVSTGGGLYRYELGDLVRVTGFVGRAPTLRFLTKEAVSDLFGEKLYTDHVQRSMIHALNANSIQPSFFLVAPVRPAGRTPCYCLFIDTKEMSAERARSVVRALEDRLCQNFHYAHCRRMGQLGPLQLFMIDNSAGAPSDIFSAKMQERGLKLGDIKPAVLDKEMGWDRHFSGRFLDVTTPDNQ